MSKTKLKKVARLHLLSALMGLMASGFWARPVFAANPGLNATVQDRNISRASSGVDLHVGDLGEKVFEVLNTTTATTITDEAGNKPSAGTLKKVCLSTGTSTDYAVIFDSQPVVSTLTTATADKRVAPPLMRSATTHVCLDLNAQFHFGLTVINSAGNGSTYLYWRPLSGRH